MNSNQTPSSFPQPKTTFQPTVINLSRRLVTPPIINLNHSLKNKFSAQPQPSFIFNREEPSKPLTQTRNEFSHLLTKHQSVPVI